MLALSREFRLLFYAILGVIVPFGFLLCFAPSHTGVYWAWEIHQLRSAMLIGAGYVGAIAYYVLLLRENDWQQTRNGMGGLVTFCIFLLVATFHSWERFKAYHITTLVWLVFYYLGPFLVPILYKSQLNRFPTPEITPTLYITRGTRVWLVARGFFYMTLAFFWLLSADMLSSVWPWNIEPLELRVFTGQIAIIGWNTLIATTGEVAWKEIRLGLALIGAIGLTQIIGFVLLTSPYNWGIGLGIFLPIMFAEWLITPVVMWLSYEHKPVME